MDKMPLQLLDVILPFIDFYDHIGGVDPRKSIFLFLRFEFVVLIFIIFDLIDVSVFFVCMLTCFFHLF